jgi:hypothetical protein
VLVEGFSDVVAIEVTASRMGRNLDAEGIAVVAVGGARTFAAFHHLFGPRGLEFELAGLCDAAEETDVERALAADGLPPNLNRAARTALGFFVCDADLEDEFLRAAGDARVQQLILAAGDGPLFVSYQNQPAIRALSLHDQLLRFLRRHKIEYASILADDVPLADTPPPIASLLNHV